MAGLRCISRCSFSAISSAGSLPAAISRSSSSSRKTPPSLRGRSWSCMSHSSLITHPTPNSNSLPLLKTVSPCQADRSTKTLEELKEITQKALASKSCESTATLKLIDTIEQLGIAYHFEEEINDLLGRFSDWNAGDDLCLTALRFRLMRNKGWPSSSDVFNKFMDKEGKFKESLQKDICGLLSLYEASYLGAKGEDKLLEAMEFTRTHLIRSMPLMPTKSRRLIAQAMETPRHLRMVRLEARNSIDECSGKSSMPLLELAKLDFDMVQSLHQKELLEIHGWWKELGLTDKLSIARDRPLECFLWTVGIFPEPCYSHCRIELTKTIAILLVIDDIYDTYGSLSDLVLFTNAIQRWDLDAMETLPEYMKICYMALYNTTNDIAYRVLKEHGWSIVQHLKRTWIDTVEAYLVEAKWFSRGYVPTLEEYLTNGVTTGGAYMAMVHAFFLMGQGVTQENVGMMTPYPKLFSSSGRILRLWDDLGTAKEEQERGDVASSIECYMRESAISCADEAKKHIRQNIRSLWVELNGELMAETALPMSIINASLNMARTAQVVYQNGDDNNLSSVKDHVQALFYNPIN